MWTGVIGAVLDVDAAAFTAEGVPPFPPAVELPMLPAVALDEDWLALAIVAFVLDADVLLSIAVEGVALAVEAVLVWAVALGAFVVDVREYLLILYLIGLLKLSLLKIYQIILL